MISSGIIWGELPELVAATPTGGSDAEPWLRWASRVEFALLGLAPALFAGAIALWICELLRRRRDFARWTLTPGHLVHTTRAGARTSISWSKVRVADCWSLEDPDDASLALGLWARHGGKAALDARVRKSIRKVAPFAGLLCAGLAAGCYLIPNFAMSMTYIAMRGPALAILAPFVIYQQIKKRTERGEALLQDLNWPHVA